MDRESLAERLERIAALREPTRRALYLYVVGSPDGVGRDEAAGAVGVSRSLAAFHLDRLVDAGLLQAGYRRLSGRAGPGAGRPAKVYRRAGPDLRISIPERDHELAARLLAEALGGRSSDDDPPELRRAAADTGIALGREARRRAGRRPSRRRLRASLMALLQERGFRPALSEDEIHLRNCPFDPLAADHADTVCAMNLALLTGVVHGLGDPGLRPDLAPAPERCCVVFRRLTPARS